MSPRAPCTHQRRTGVARLRSREGYTFGCAFLVLVLKAAFDLTAETSRHIVVPAGYKLGPAQELKQLAQPILVPFEALDAVLLVRCHRVSQKGRGGSVLCPAPLSAPRGSAACRDGWACVGSFRSLRLNLTFPDDEIGFNKPTQPRFSFVSVA